MCAGSELIHTVSLMNLEQETRKEEAYSGMYSFLLMLAVSMRGVELKEMMLSNTCVHRWLCKIKYHCNCQFQWLDKKIQKDPS